MDQTKGAAQSDSPPPLTVRDAAFGFKPFGTEGDKNADAKVGPSVEPLNVLVYLATP